jgi:hypothetical protein
MSVQRGVEQVKAVQLAEDRRLQNMDNGEWILRMSFFNALKLGNCLVVLKIVKIVERELYLRIVGCAIRRSRHRRSRRAEDLRANEQGIYYQGTEETQ